MELPYRHLAAIALRFVEEAIGNQLSEDGDFIVVMPTPQGFRSLPTPVASALSQARAPAGVRRSVGIGGPFELHRHRERRRDTCERPYLEARIERLVPFGLGVDRRVVLPRALARHPQEPVISPNLRHLHRRVEGGELGLGFAGPFLAFFEFAVVAIAALDSLDLALDFGTICAQQRSKSADPLELTQTISVD